MINEELPCLPLIAERHINKVRLINENYTGKHIEMRVFIQNWETTALGFNWFGCEKPTKAYTTVVLDETEAFYSVFFGNRLAYTIKSPLNEFFVDLKEQKMKSVLESKHYVNPNLGVR